ncbi:DUF1800 domain-containing protein [Mitsuaria sp. GD03876]|uniref:DUF1800 domain-containing protein n=1 Tax=Mitsuaria sp. GD03876 TaxID=2975399 RepID=UPI002447EAA3|nr:DUF1800 domain-containing protein [Mitsuaria sp. GD03876]MDH0864910.1 DUF1800 domain-containing protein [Mitsuaria sp. GD03876]
MSLPTASVPIPRRALLLGATASAALAACGGLPSAPDVPMDATQRQRAANRIGWGATQSQLDEIDRLGWGRYVERQFKADPKAPMPAPIQARIDALGISQGDVASRVWAAESFRRNGDKGATEEERAAARKAYQEAQGLAARETGERQLLRELYGEQQLLEHLSWFWFNHFNVHQGKRDIRLLLADYQDRALRPQALGSFRRMLGAVARHPAMLRYLDNDQNAVRAINENYARELLELHTMGVDGGYTQRDVQELARVLTGFGVRVDPDPAKVAPRFERLYQRDGLFEFHPGRHDFGDKQLLGHTIKGRGADELDEVLDLLTAQPATARFVCRKLAVFFLSDQPPQPVVDAMTAAFLRTKGDVPATLRPLLYAPQFASAESPKFKDPHHYLLSSLRAGFERRELQNAQPLQNWLRRLGQGLYDKQTPDGYPMTADAWNSPGQMTLRFEIARQMGSGAAPLYRPDGVTTPVPMPDLSPLRTRIEPTLATTTMAALSQTTSPQQWLTLLFSSPDFMYR